MQSIQLEECHWIKSRAGQHILHPLCVPKPTLKWDIHGKLVHRACGCSCPSNLPHLTVPLGLGGFMFVTLPKTNPSGEDRQGGPVSFMDYSQYTGQDSGFTPLQAAEPGTWPTGRTGLAPTSEASKSPT